jgi:hypothetical protein
MVWLFAEITASELNIEARRQCVFTVNLKCVHFSDNGCCE